MILNQMSNLQQRLIISSISAIIMFVVIFLSYNPLFGFLFTLLIAGVIGLALREYYRIATVKGFLPLNKIGIIGSTIFLCVVFWDTQVNYAFFYPEIVLGLILAAAFLYYFFKGSDPLVNIAITIFGIAYLTLPLSCLIYINYFEDMPFVRDGRWCLIYLLVVTKITDIGAFFIGKKLGSKKLSPTISPQKTWEGAFGGFCSAIGTSMLFYIFFHLFFRHPPFEITLWQSIWLAILISITAQFGDLAESILKRDTGVKDSGSRLPGLGGFLDLVDSLVFTSPLMYFFLQLH